MLLRRPHLACVLSAVLADSGGGWWSFRIASAQALPVSVGRGGKKGRAAVDDAKLRSNSLACSCCEALLNSVPRPSGTTQILHKLSIHWQWP